MQRFPAGGLQAAGDEQVMDIQAFGADFGAQSCLPTGTGGPGTNPEVQLIRIKHQPGQGPGQQRGRGTRAAIPGRAGGQTWVSAPDLPPRMHVTGLLAGPGPAPPRGE